MAMFEKQNEGKSNIRITVPNYVVVLVAITLIIALVIVVVKLYPDVLFWLR
jgi:hypothetical protein